MSQLVRHCLELRLRSFWLAIVRLLETTIEVLTIAFDHCLSALGCLARHCLLLSVFAWAVIADFFRPMLCSPPNFSSYLWKNLLQMTMGH